MPDSTAALSVLVLAWDEAAPTVRTVVEAAPTVGSLLVLLPPALPAPPLPSPPPQPVPASPPAPPAAPATLANDNQALASSTEAIPAPVAPGPAAALATPPAPEAARPPTAPATPAVRLLYLLASELPATVRSSSFRVPAAPYLGATPAATEVATEPTQPPAPTSPAAKAPALAQRRQAAPANTLAGASPGTLPTAAAAPTGVPAAAAPTGVSVVAAPTGMRAAAVPEPLAEAAFAANEIIDPDPEEELTPGPQPQPTATTPADMPQLADPAPGRFFPVLGPFGNRLPQFDTSPAVARPAPVAAPDPEDTPEEQAVGFAASVAAARQYTAPDLNSQVIRYARLAVPTALAAGRYDVIYAPAWPTWLAALELRQRTSRPLVLHLPALAAGRQPADTAAGWPAEIQRQVLRQADLVLVETYALARRLRRELGLPSAAVRVVPARDTAAIARALRRATRVPK